LGWITGALSLLAYFLIFMTFEGWRILLACGAVFMFASPISGVMILQAELVELFLSIEQNTFESKQALQEVARKIDV
jgi:hypothetical protein